jgi:hypothetical protein
MRGAPSPCDAQVTDLPSLAQPTAQAGRGAGVADPLIIAREAAVTFQRALEGGSTRDLAEIDPQAQFREAIREPDPKGVVAGRIAVGQDGVPGRGGRPGLGRTPRGRKLGSDRQPTIKPADMVCILFGIPIRSETGTTRS